MTRRTFLIGSLSALVACAGLSWPVYKSFGALPKGKFDSPNWADGSFHNLPEDSLPWDLSTEPEYNGGWIKFFLSKDGNRYPPKPVQTMKTDLKNLKNGEFVWLGHSSLLLKLADKTICIDPVLSHRASPVPFTIQAWAGSSPYEAYDFPELDYLCISHDHWDHLDLLAVKELKYKNVICGKGVGAHFDAWGNSGPLIELDWWDTLDLDGLKLVFTPSRHFSGRGTTRNKSLWGGFIFDAGPCQRVYFTGDGGYGKHFLEIGKRFGGFDLVFPDSAQYNKAWSNVHMFPEQAVQAVIDCGGKRACPVHMGRFTLSWHPWDEPRKRFEARAKELAVDSDFPLIGEKLSVIKKPASSAKN